MAVLKDAMTGKTELPLNLSKSACEYLQDLRQNLEMAQTMPKNMLRELKANMWHDTI